MSPSNDTLFPRGAKITNDNFTGTAYLQMLIDADNLNPTAVGNVTFEPGARTRWHSHPGGQIFLVTDGVGYYQEKGQPKKILRKGDVIKCPPNTPHWHGASADEHFVQVAVTNNQHGATQWFEPVTDDQFKNQGVSFAYNSIQPIFLWLRKNPRVTREQTAPPANPVDSS